MAEKKAVFLYDGISNLPDSILCHILSFIPTKYSVRTSVLSRRWEQLYTFVPNLDLKYHALFRNSDSPASDATSFVQFVNCLFILYNVSRMNKFSLRFTDFGEFSGHFPIVSWISFVAHRNVQKIDISVCLRVRRTLPCELFSCKTLVQLRLEGRFNIVLPGFVCLPCLKTCSLQRVCFLNNESATRLFQSCPVLECLCLTICFVGDGVKFLDISVPTLKTLRIWDSDNCPLLLKLPNLLSFKYCGPTTNKFLGLESLKSMVDCSIDYEPDSFTSDGVVVELLRMVSHVPKLGLNCELMEAFLRSGNSLPTFKNLTRLELGPISGLSSRLLSNLLEKSSQLESIEFNQRARDEEERDDDNSYSLPEHVPVCVALHIKEVEFDFAGSGYECKMIKYFLKHAKNLKLMKIRNSSGWNEQCEISSAACQIVLVP